MTAFSRETVTEIERAAVAAWNETQQQAFRPRYSSAGGPCIRQLAIEAQGAKNEISDPRHMLAAACGKAVGEAMEAGNKKLGWVTQEHVELPDCRVLVQGSLDAANHDTVLDYKVVNDKQWARLERGPRFKCQFQCNGYSVSKGLPFWALAYLRGSSIFDKGGKLDWRIFSGKADPVLARAMGRIWETIDEHTRAGTLPQIPGGFTKERFPCGSRDGKWKCPHQGDCYGSSETREGSGAEDHRRGVVLNSQGPAPDHRGDHPDCEEPAEHPAELRLPGGG